MAETKTKLSRIQFRDPDHRARKQVRILQGLFLIEGEDLDMGEVITKVLRERVALESKKHPTIVTLSSSAPARSDEEE